TLPLPPRRRPSSTPRDLAEPGASSGDLFPAMTTRRRSRSRRAPAEAVAGSMSLSADSERRRPDRDYGGALVDDEPVGLVGRMLPAATEPVDLPAQVGERRQQRRAGDPAVRDDLEIAVQQPPSVVLESRAHEQQV